MRPRLNNDRANYVYVFVAGDRVKVGVATNVEKRRLQLQAACPLPLALFYKTKPMLRSVVEQIEHRAHRLLSEKRLHGEWFNCSPEEATEAVRAAKIYVKNRRANVAYQPDIRRLRSLGKLRNGVDLLTKFYSGDAL